MKKSKHVFMLILKPSTVDFTEIWLCLLWALMSCKDHSQGLYPTHGRANTGYLLHSRVWWVLSIGVVIRALRPHFARYKLELCFLTWIYALCTSSKRISTTSSLKMFRVCVFDGWGPPTPTNQPTKVWYDTSIRVPSSQNSSMMVNEKLLVIMQCNWSYPSTFHNMMNPSLPPSAF